MPRAKTTDQRQSAPKALGHIKHPLSARQQREISRFAANFGLEPSQVLRSIQARLSPAVETAVTELVRQSDTYEQAKADHDRALRAQVLERIGTDTRSPTHARAVDDVAPEDTADTLVLARTGT